IQRSVVLEGSRIKDHAWVKSTIVGWHGTVGKWARLENVTVMGDDVTIADEVYVNGGSILPHKTIKANIDGKISISYSISYKTMLTCLFLSFSPCHYHVRKKKKTNSEIL